jgi:hypothetical protein
MWGRPGGHPGSDRHAIDWETVVPSVDGTPVTHIAFRPEEGRPESTMVQIVAWHGRTFNEHATVNGGSLGGSCSVPDINRQ